VGTPVANLPRLATVFAKLGDITDASPTGLYRGVPADERRAERRERLLEAGLELLGTEGWQATTVRGVCEQARLNPRYFYESFTDRDELLLAVFERVAAEILAAIVTALEQAPNDAHGRARAAIGAAVELLTDDPRKGRVALIEAMGSEALMRRRLDTLDGFAQLVADTAREFYGAEALDPVETQLTAQVLAGGITEAMIAWLEGRLDVSRDRLVEHCAALFVAAAGVSGV
jgi:AcrR family transcriptional regulator